MIAICNLRALGHKALFIKRICNLLTCEKDRQFHKMAKFGICFDVDGVLAKGPDVIPSVKSAFGKLVNSNGDWVVPVAFVTNSAILRSLRADYLSRLLGIQVRESQIVQAPTPIEAFTSLHKKFSLVIGQGDVCTLAKENKLENVCTIDEVSKAYPLLDMVDSTKRSRVVTTEGKNSFPKVEAIVSMGEPTNWETSLQLIVDLLKTDGLPDNSPNLDGPHVPIYACSFDLEYKSRSHIPRFGHGAFLACLNTLYEKATGRSLTYEGLIGKPTEITYRYADHVLNAEARRMNLPTPLKTFYMIGDTPEVDITGANLYKIYLNNLHHHKDQGHDEKEALLLCNNSLPKCRRIPPNEMFLGGCAKNVEALLVCTGVYEKGEKLGIGNDNVAMGMNFEKSLEVPDAVFDTAGEAIHHVLRKENFS